MKKCRFLLFVICIALLLAFPVQAETADSYRIQTSDLDFSLIFPNDYDIFTQNTAESDPLFSKYGYEKSELMQLFKETNAYLLAHSRDLESSIDVTVTENIFPNLSYLADETIESVYSELQSELAKIGRTVTDFEIYRRPALTFLCIDWYDENSNYARQYYTIVNGQAINITLVSFIGEVTQPQKENLLSVIDSMKLNPVTPSANAPSFTYTDSDTGLSFTVPRGWLEDEFLEEKKFLKAKFSLEQGYDLQIHYGSYDLWEETPALSKITLKRSDLDTIFTTFSMEELGELMGEPYVDAELVTYNGKTFLKAVMTEERDTYGITFTVTMTQLVLIDNGWAHYFQFSGTSADPHYADFESLVSSVKFPITTPSQHQPQDTVSEDFDEPNAMMQDQDVNPSSLILMIVMYILLFLALASVVTVIVVLLKRRKNKASSNPQKTVNPLPYQTPTERPLFCHQCGTRLPEDSAFCHNCGTKVKIVDSSNS